MRTEVYEFGGRPVIKTLTLPIRNSRSASASSRCSATTRWRRGAMRASRSSPSTRQAQAVGRRAVQYRLVPEDWDYQWFYQGRELGLQDRHPRQAGRRRRASCDLTRRQARPSSRSRSIGAITGSRSIDSSLGCRLQLSLLCRLGRPHRAPATRRTACRSSPTRSMYKAGDTAKLLIKPPFAGQVLIAIATDHVIKSWTVDASPEGTAVEVPVDAAWGAGRLCAGHRLPARPVTTTRSRPRHRRFLARHRSRSAQPRGLLRPCPIDVAPRQAASTCRSMSGGVTRRSPGLCDPGGGG